MLIEIDLPEGVIRKIKALNLLVGRAASDIEGLIMTLVDRSVSLEIIARLGLEDEVDTAPMRSVAPPQPRLQYEQNRDDASGISEGLGDDAPEEEPEEHFLGAAAEKSHGKAHPLNASEIYADSTVQDPAHEAVSAAPRQPVGVRAEAAFSDVAGIPAPQEGRVADESPPVRARSRKKQRPLPPKAKVSLFDSEANSF